MQVRTLLPTERIRMKVIADKKNKYVAMFNPENGFYIRMGENDVDPFRAGHPELADICITTVCNNNCSYCYQNSKSDGYHMPLEDYKFIIGQLNRTLQIAIGGGEPTLHPDFIEILKATREAVIVPNYTTNGIVLDFYEKHKWDRMKDFIKYDDERERIGDILKATKYYCGAVAVSYHENMDVVKIATKKFIEEGITTNVHYVVNEDNIEEAGEFLTEDFEGLHAVIYLLYKPIGRATSSEVIEVSSIPRLEKFINRVTELSEQTGIKIGFDACFCNYLVRYTDFDPTYFDSCDSGRFSIYISEQLDVSPCSFNKNVFGNLREQSLEEIWNGRKFEEYREGIRENKCKGKCDLFELCYGGCPILPINLCKEDYVEEK